MSSAGPLRCPGPGYTAFFGPARMGRMPGTSWPRSAPDGRPHAAGVGVVWHDGDLYFTRKARNLKANPACAIAVKLPGMDLTLDGEAARATEPETLEKVAALYRELGWPARVKSGSFTAPYSAPSAGPAPLGSLPLHLHPGGRAEHGRAHSHPLALRPGLSRQPPVFSWRFGRRAHTAPGCTPAPPRPPGASPRGRPPYGYTLADADPYSE